jgi:hypothetical protein
VVRRHALAAAGGFSEDLRFNGAEDYDLWLRLARARHIFGYLHEVLGLYRVHDGGITAAAERHCDNHLNVLDAHFCAFPSPTFYQRYLIRRLRAATIRGAVQTLLRQREYERARRLLGRAAKEDPLSWKTWLLGACSTVRVSP